ncbi:MAG TPA: hypothetical protein VKZ67_08890 [Natronosporangium sp.]|nr:hypothetical protein [Natronosporangium sp.]
MGTRGQPGQESTPRRKLSPEEELELAEEPDFAEEHTQPTFADQQEGGLERAREPESPHGYAGMDDRSAKRRRQGEDRT